MLKCLISNDESVLNEIYKIYLDRPKILHVKKNRPTLFNVPQSDKIFCQFRFTVNNVNVTKSVPCLLGGWSPLEWVPRSKHITYLIHDDNQAPDKMSDILHV